MAKAPKKATAKKTSTPGNLLENANVVHALSYFPYLIGAIGMYFLGQSNKKEAMHHISYSAIMGAIVIVLFFVLNGFFANVVNLVYIGVSAFFAYKAYNGEDVQVEILDTIEDKISEKVKK